MRGWQGRWHAGHCHGMLFAEWAPAHSARHASAHRCGQAHFVIESCIAGLPLPSCGWLLSCRKVASAGIADWCVRKRSARCRQICLCCTLVTTQRMVRRSWSHWRACHALLWKLHPPESGGRCIPVAQGCGSQQCCCPGHNTNSGPANVWEKWTGDGRTWCAMSCCLLSSSWAWHLFHLHGSVECQRYN